MNNFYNGPQDQFNYQGYYANTYNLWQNSRYYDTNNLSLGNYTASEWNNSEETSVETDASPENINKNRRVVIRDDLYRDPELFNNPQEDCSYGPIHNPSHYGWPQQNWVKAGDYTYDAEQGPSGYVNMQQQHVYNNRLEKRLNNILKEPAKMTKAESMMHKMGWQGGALGKTGDGILEPIAPNAAYATTTAGFGHRKEQEKQKNNKDPENKEHFTTNVLQTILEFVKNDCELEMVFDKSLWKEERKRVHRLVNDAIGSECLETIDTEEQLELLEQIQQYNSFILSTHSEGAVPNRQLTIFKEAPSHVYLITPDDLKKEDEEEKENEILDIDDSNPFLKSITKNIKEEISNKLEMDRRRIYDTIVDYFIEFHGSRLYSEFRFLGLFSEDEIDSINKFLKDISNCLEDNFLDVREDMVVLFKDSYKRVKLFENDNGSAVIHKVFEGKK